MANLQECRRIDEAGILQNALQSFGNRLGYGQGVVGQHFEHLKDNCRLSRKVEKIQKFTINILTLTL